MFLKATIQKEFEIIKQDSDNCWTYYVDTIKQCSQDETKYTPEQKLTMIEESKSHVLNSLAQYNKIREYYQEAKAANILLTIQNNI